MIAIHRYPLESGENVLHLPEGAMFLSVHEDNGPQVWARVDTEKPLVARKVYLACTGEDLTNRPGMGVVGFMGTVLVHVPFTTLVFHAFEET